MPQSQGVRGSGLVAAGIGWGAAIGVALGMLLIAPAMSGELGAGAGASAAPANADSAGTADTGDTADSAASTDPAVARAQQQANQANELLAEHAEGLVEGLLDGAAVTMIRTAGASEEDAAGVRWLANAAGASNSGGLKLTEKFADRNAADELSSIIANTIPAGVQLPVENRSPGTHAGVSLGAALAADPDTGEGVTSSSDRALVLEALEQAGFIELKGQTVPASVVVVVVGEDMAEDGFASQLLADFVEALGEGVPVIVATQGEAPKLTAATAVSNVDTEAGRISAVRAAAEHKG